jgi:hypothetical protein
MGERERELELFISPLLAPPLSYNSIIHHDSYAQATTEVHAVRNVLTANRVKESSIWPIGT